MPVVDGPQPRVEGEASRTDQPAIRRAQCVQIRHYALMSDAVLRGRRTFSNGTFASDEGQRRIDEMLRSMRLIADIGDGVPSFYVDECGVFWMHSESVARFSSSAIRLPSRVLGSHRGIDAQVNW